jgi:hypothetical protein
MYCGGSQFRFTKSKRKNRAVEGHYGFFRIYVYGFLQIAFKVQNEPN